MYSLGFEGLGDKSLPPEAVVGSEGQCLYGTEPRRSTWSSGTLSYHCLLGALFILLSLSISVCAMNIDVNHVKCHTSQTMSPFFSPNHFAL